MPLARISAGSVEAFVAAMNAKAKDLGMDNTTFRTPHGLPPSNRKIADGDLTTPADFALLSRYLVLQTDVLSYSAIQSRPFGQKQRGQPVMMDNHHNLLGRVPGVDGLKTGFTNGAGYCLSATAQRGTRRVIVVAMGSPDAKTRDLTVAEMIERGFSQIAANSPAFVADPRSTSVQGAPTSATVLDIGYPSAATTPASDEIRITVPAAIPAKKR